MKAAPKIGGKRAVVLNAFFTLLTGLGILMALFGIGAELLPGAHSGLNLPQILLIAAGLLLFLMAFALRRAPVRRWVLGKMRKHWAPGLVITAITLIALEGVLVAAGIPTYFPPAIDDVPQPFYELEPWWTCDEAGCHYVYDEAVAACENREFDGRGCIINQQGFHDTQDFVAGDDLGERMRILMLGDSTTFGESADIGKSYVETIESNFPQSIVWNTGIPGTGTHQALAIFQVYAPVLQPHLTVLGFNLTDFTDNIVPVDHQLIGVDWKNKPFRISRYRIGSSGNAIKLDERGLYYARHYGVHPPDSEIERLIGRTRLGSLLPRLLHGIRWRRDQGMKYSVPIASQTADITRGYLRDLRDSAMAQGTDLLVLLITARADISAPRLSYQTVVQLMAELEIPYLNPIHALDAELDYAPGGHWNNAGHQKAGAMLSACIEAFQISGDLSDCEQVEMP